MRRRVFAAIKISDRLTADILDWEKKFRRLPVRWLAGKNLHITLVPPWYEKNIDEVKETLGQIGGVSGPFKISFQEVKYGPDPGRPRLIWAEGPAPKELLLIKQILEKVLKQKGEKRSFLLHLTLARFRPETFLSFPEKHLKERVNWKDKIKSVVLMESHLSRSGADYEVLEEYRLNNA